MENLNVGSTKIYDPPITSPYTWDLVDYEEESKLKVGDIVAKKALLGTYTSNRYKVVVPTIINGQYGIVPVSSPFDLPKYYYREDLILIESANKKESFLYKEGNFVLFRYKDLTGLNKILTGQILSRFTINKSMTEPYPVREKYYQIKDINSCNLEYVVKESDIIERIEKTTKTKKSWSAVKSIEAARKFINSINEEKPLNIKIAKKQIKLNFKN